MNEPIRRLSLLAGLLVVALLVASTWIQALGAGSLNDRPGNQRTALANYGQERGQILIDGKPIARSVPVDDALRWQRQYPEAQTYAHLTGYYSFEYGAGGGLEGAANSLLSGTDDQLFYGRIADIIAGRKPTGASLELTIDARAQQAAVQALGGQRGAVVALDPSTGAILAMYSSPSYDPSPLVSHAEGVPQEAWKQLTGDESQPMVNRAIAGNLYPPGSVFKVVTAAAALESGDYEPDSELPGPAVLDLPQTESDLPNSDKAPCGPGDQATLATAMQKSCNTTFGYLGMELGGDALREQASKFGFGDSLDIPMAVTPSTVPTELNEPQEAQAAVGQYDVRATPLQIAMMSAGVANDGVVMRPHVVEKVQGSDLSTISQTRPEQLSRAVAPETARQLTEMMTSVVESGTGTQAAVPGTTVAGKTGTAQHAEGAAPHAWFTGFAPADNPKVAVAVVVESGGAAGSQASGGSVAGPISAAVMQAVLQ